MLYSLTNFCYRACGTVVLFLIGVPRLALSNGMLKVVYRICACRDIK